MSSNFTLTSLLTPDSYMVMPYKTSTYSIVFFLWVIKINWDLFFNFVMYWPKVSTLASSKAASTSSRMQNGAGLDFMIAKSKLIAVKVFSPPDKAEILFNFFPGGEAIISTPVSSRLLILVLHHHHRIIL